MLCWKELCQNEVKEGSNFCSKSCQNSWSVMAHRDRKRSRAKSMMGNCCKICGYNRCSRALEFHHADSNEKEFGLASKFTHSWEVLQPELEKCVLLCTNCHREVHAGMSTVDLGQTINFIPVKPYKKPKEPRRERKLKDGPKPRKKKINWPSMQWLEAEIEKTNFSQLGKRLGVSDNAIRKHMMKEKEATRAGNDPATSRLTDERSTN